MGLKSALRLRPIRMIVTRVCLCRCCCCCWCRYYCCCCCCGFFLVVFYLRPRTVATIRASTATTTASTPTSLSLSASTSSPTLTPTQYAFVYCTTAAPAAAAVAVAVVAGGLGVVVMGEHGGKWNRERGTGAGFACMRGKEMHNIRAQSTVQIEHTAWLEEEEEEGG